MASALPGDAPAAVSFLENMLKYDPNQRATAYESMCHPYLSLVRDTSREKRGTTLIETQDIEAMQLTRSNMKKMIYKEILDFHREHEATLAGISTDCPQLTLMDSAESPEAARMDP